MAVNKQFKKYISETTAPLIVQGKGAVQEGVHKRYPTVRD